ncbi:CAP domain-containing protein [Blastomonas sp.]|uniref:CAP domain-containing protein n=1 Tax=Blastomonas sp. TaxID=1909299 RepID=UPI00262AE603|nr:CAP domain-containing protein [Blastomonas sp.]MDM7956256.1 CAP domain-containing protein [Blastomonas sp.]
MPLHPISSSAQRPLKSPTARDTGRFTLRRSACLLAAVAAMGLAGPGQARGELRSVELKTDMLAAHNAARKQVGLGPMVWSPILAADAKKYASQMSRSRQFAHSNPVRGAKPQGENLWMGTHDAYSFAEMAGSWVDERQLYDGGSISQAMSNGTFGAIGHYTQIIWRGTSKVGCAVVSNPDEDYLVCRYLPAGNVMGASPLD